jgi:hypothetical protein
METWGLARMQYQYIDLGHADFDAGVTKVRIFVPITTPV